MRKATKANGEKTQEDLEFEAMLERDALEWEEMEQEALENTNYKTLYENVLEQVQLLRQQNETIPIYIKCDICNSESHNEACGKMYHDLKEELNEMTQDRDRIHEDRFKLVQELEELKSRLSKKDEIIKELKKLYFYSENNSWLCSSDFQYGDMIDYKDLEIDSPITKKKFVGGKLAREVKKKIEELENVGN